MSLIDKLFGKNGKNTQEAESTEGAASAAAASDNAAAGGTVGAAKGTVDSSADTGAGCTTTEESARIYAFAKANYSADNTEKIFNTKQAESYYTKSEDVQVFSERLIEYGFDSPDGLDAYLKELWKNDDKMRVLIPVIKVAAFANRDKYDSKYKDLSLYNYTL